jgi:hypothetical protein
MTARHPGQDRETGQSEHDSMDWTAGTGKLGNKGAETGRRAGQVGQASWIGQLGQEKSSKTVMGGKIQLDS